MLTISSLAHIEGITLSAGEEVDEVTGGASGMGVEKIDEVGNQLVKDRLLGCMRQVLCFYSRISGKERSQGWEEEDGEQG